MNWDKLIADFFIQNHKPNMNYCDVGSCYGIFSDLFLQLAKPNGKVYSFEINPLNPQITNTIFERIAISDIDGYESVYDGGTHMSNILGHDVGYNSSPFKSKIESIRLDTYFKDKELNCLKIDIEGAELKAIRGGIETIKKCDVVVIECHLDEHWPDIFDLLDGLGFKDLSTGLDIQRDKRPYQVSKRLV